MTSAEAAAALTRALDGWRTPAGHPTRLTVRGLTATLRTVGPEHEGRGFHVADFAWHAGSKRYYMTSPSVGAERALRAHLGRLVYGAADLFRPLRGFGSPPEEAADLRVGDRINYLDRNAQFSVRGGGTYPGVITEIHTRRGGSIRYTAMLDQGREIWAARNYLVRISGLGAFGASFGSSFRVGRVYVIHAWGGQTYFRADEDLKNGGMRGRRVEWPEGRRVPKAGVSGTVSRGDMCEWQEAAAVPAAVREKF